MSSGREVSRREHRIPGRVFVGRPSPSRNRKLPKELERRRDDEMKRVERLKKEAS
jgi:hypothetical protein